MNKIQTVIFDFDGTLADTFDMVKKAFLKTLKKIGGPLPITPYLNDISSYTLKDMFQKVGVKDEQRLDDALETYGRAYRRLSMRDVKLFSGVLETLDALHMCSYRIAIGTNEVRENLENHFAALNIKEYFSATACADEVGRCKPNPDMVFRILDDIGSNPENTVFVGDSVLDIAAGKAAGCYTCAVTYGSQSETKLRSHSPDWAIHHPMDLLHILDLPVYHGTPFGGKISMSGHWRKTRFSTVENRKIPARWSQAK